jgi:hypothetical protein
MGYDDVRYFTADEPYVVVSIASTSDPHAPLADDPNRRAVLRLKFDDFSRAFDRQLMEKHHIVLYDEAAADRVVAFVREHVDVALVLCHCFVPGTLIGGRTTAPIECVSDQVFGHDGQLHKARVVMKRQYNGDLVVVRSRGTWPIRCTPEHPLLVVRPYRYGTEARKPTWKPPRGTSAWSDWFARQPQWLRADSLQKDDFLVSPRIASASYDEPVHWPVVSSHHNSHHSAAPIKPDSNVAWAMGLYIADGNSSDGSIHYTLSLHDDVDRLVQALSVLGLSARVKRFPSYVRVRAHSVTAARSFKVWFGSRAPEKKIPEFLYDWDTRALLAGLMAGDGSYNPKRESWQFRVTSRVLAMQVWQLLVSFGEYPYLREEIRCTGYPNARQVYAVEWRRADQHYTAHWNGWYLMPVTSIGREAYSGPVYNLAVEEAETYLANGAVAHNCEAGVSRSVGMAAALRSLGTPWERRSPVVRGNRLVYWLTRLALEDP